jgi:pyruvate-formate lyase-activating enzyme
MADGKLWHNPGAIGMPANDGTPRVWYSRLSVGESGIEVRLVSLKYDVHSAARKMRQSGLPEGYAAALETGLWPSCDILPNQELGLTGQPIAAHRILWNGASDPYSSEPRTPARLRPKFSDPEITATGQRRASVKIKKLDTVWFNTGTLCNLTCDNCYIESSPKNDRLAYLTLAEVQCFLNEAMARDPRPSEIGFTGGEPFMNPQILEMLDASLSAGFKALVLTNAMRPMQRLKSRLLAINSRFPGKLAVRVSLDHYEPVGHERVRGKRTWQPTIDGLMWLAENGFDVSVAGRTIWDETEATMRNGYRALFAELGLHVNPDDPIRVVLFPEMRADEDVPEITEQCWGILNRSPDSVMCASSRMVVKRKGAPRPTVVACTLLPFDSAFDLGATLADATRPVRLNHRYCARFCVLGGASCSAHS